MEADGEDDDFINGLPDDFFDNLKFEECEPDAKVLAKLDELDAFDRFERIWSDETASVKSKPDLPGAARPVLTTSRASWESGRLLSFTPFLGHLWRIG